MKGKFIVIEGVDGSGKGTQAKLLYNYLKKRKKKVRLISFPQYGKPSAYFIENYLHGRYGDATKINPKQASILYAVDRFELGITVRDWLRKGYVVIADRYVASNLGHQGSKMKTAKARKAFMQWNYELEYKIFNIPKPDINLVLLVPPKIAFNLIAKKQIRSYLKGKKRDQLEGSLPHLRRAYASYETAMKLFPREFTSVNCAPKGKLLTITEIHEIIREKIKRHIRI